MNPETEPAPKRRVGRPLVFETVERLQAAIDDYFSKTAEADYLITGLALHLNTSRETLINYEGRPEFFDAVKGAKLRIEMAYERDLRLKGNAGSIFGLKNFGWSDRSEVGLTSPDGSMTPKLEAPKSMVDDFIKMVKDKTSRDA